MKTFTLDTEILSHTKKWLDNLRESPLLSNPENYSKYLAVKEYYVKSQRAILEGEKIKGESYVCPARKKPNWDKEDLVYPN